MEVETPASHATHLHACQRSLMQTGANKCYVMRQVQVNSLPVYTQVCDGELCREGNEDCEINSFCSTDKIPGNNAATAQLHVQHTRNAAGTGEQSSCLYAGMRRRALPCRRGVNEDCKINSFCNTDKITGNDVAIARVKHTRGSEHSPCFLHQSSSLTVMPDYSNSDLYSPRLRHFSVRCLLLMFLLLFEPSLLRNRRECYMTLN